MEELDYKKYEKPESYYKDKYLQQNYLGQGSFGQVYKGVNQENGQNVAIKIMQTNTNELKKGAVTREFKMLDIQHKNIVNYIETFYIINGSCDMSQPDQNMGANLFFIMDLMDGDLDRFIQKENLAFNESQLINFYLQISEGISELHQQSISHRDIKPLNILYKKEEDGNYQLKIGDFNTIKILKQEGQSTKTYTGTKKYMPPEYNNCTDIDKLDLQKCDIYSLGVTFLELLYGTQQFSIQQIKQRDYTKKIDEKIKSEDLKNLLESMVDNVEKRPDIQTICAVLKCLNNQYNLQSKIKQEYEQQIQLKEQIISQKEQENNKIIQEKEQSQIKQNEQIQQIKNLKDSNKEMKSKIEEKIKIIQDQKQQIEKIEQEKINLKTNNEENQKLSQELAGINKGLTE
ncbi:Protein kinase-like domain [Pseudocohnilembus persalinus]|uniref:Protein kinase-like domain n=1 Tax=Pseudocohnilembus persalinus TaxID=266149 RepID=A0A0V0QQC4_PSEPJ|nr:Protein kinase-like domain [Pseudocohnilembus persalinus]|eukprot:KRX04327.1 Protein kinase-like domain [Pseudocohnilembus persalinus]